MIGAALAAVVTAAASGCATGPAGSSSTGVHDGAADGGAELARAEAARRSTNTAAHERFVSLLSAREFAQAVEMFYLPDAMPSAERDSFQAKARHTLRLMTAEFGRIDEDELVASRFPFFHVHFTSAGFEDCPRMVGTSNVSQVRFSRRGNGYIRTLMCPSSSEPRVAMVAYGLGPETSDAREQTIDVCSALMVALRNAASADSARETCEQQVPLTP